MGGGAMKNTIMFVVSFLMFTFTVSYAKAEKVTVKWFGQACFTLTLSNGKTIAIDPYSEKLDYDLPEISADIVLTTHEHFDHNNTAAIKGDPTVLRGLTKGGADYNKIDYKEEGVNIYNVNSYHDEENGSKRGKNSIFVIRTGGRSIVHLGDLGHVLSNKQVAEIGQVDFLLIPVGGHFTIDASGADKVISQLKPKVVIPMHFKTDKTGKLPISTKADFLKDKRYVEISKNEYEFDLSKEYKGLNYIVLNYK
jgi:L-ascorbate metabolism protein UlaG (beta-lactamase superfamily)